MVSGWGALLAGAQAPKTFSVLTYALACESASRPLTSTCRDCRAWIICTHPHVCWGDRRAVEARGWRVGMLANRRWGWWQINCRVHERRESTREAACMITKRWLSIHCALAHLPDHRQCPLGQPTVRAPFEDQPCHRGTKRNNRQIKVGQSARSLRVAQLSKRAC